MSLVAGFFVRGLCGGRLLCGIVVRSFRIHFGPLLFLAFLFFFMFSSWFVVPTVASF